MLHSPLNAELNLEERQKHQYTAKKLKKKKKVS